MMSSTALKLPTRLHVLILQHPQEPREPLSSARLAHLALPHSTLQVGLSWPNLKKALGREAVASRWGVLYLGSGIQGDTAQPRSRVGRRPGDDRQGRIEFVTQKGLLTAPPESLEGLVILDGTWSQAKALWWRNAWLLKLKRMILRPSQPSLYRELRREPRKECLSTLESIAEALVSLGEPPETGEKLRELFAEHLQNLRETIREDKKQRLTS